MSHHRHTPRLPILLVCAAWLLVLGVSGAAADQPDPSKEQRAEAERLFRAGEQAYHAGKYGLAAQAFEASYALLPAPQIAFSMAQAYRLQYFVDKQPAGLRRAVELYRLYLDQSPRGGRRDVAVTHLAELEPILMRLEAAATPERTPEPASGSSGKAAVMVTSPVDGAHGRIAGTEGPLPLEVELAPGRYEATVTARGHEPGTKTVDVVADRFFVVEVPLQPIPARIAVRASTDATVLVDGRVVGRTPPGGPIELSAGEHRVSVRARGRRLWRKDVALDRGEAMALDVELRRTRQRIGSYAVLGLGGVLFAGATVTGLVAASEDARARELERQYQREGLTRSDLERYGEHRDQRYQATVATYTLIGLGVAAGVGGLLLYWYDLPAVEPVQPEKPTPSTPRITPMIERDGVGMSVSGQF
jgi:hypothetical protein